MNCIIIDDEQSARITLEAMIQKFCPGVEVCGMAGNLEEGIRLIERLQPDLIFLDIQMPGGNGFQLLEKLNGQFPAIIFTTAYDQYALKALKLGALDYLLKPIDLLELQEAIEKVAPKSLENEEADSFTNWDGQPQGKLVVSTLEGYYILKFPDIVRLEADRNYTNIHVLDGQKLVSSRTLGFFEERLPKGMFFRTHKSHIVNLNEIHLVSRGPAGTLQTSDGAEIQISKNKKSLLMKLLQE